MISLSLSESTTDPTKQSNFGGETPPNLAAFQNIVLNYVWSPIVWRNGYRLKSHFESCSYFALDFDSGVTLSEMVSFATEAGLAHIIGTTKSHQKTKTTASGKVSPAVDRFRVVFKAETPCIDRELFEYNMGLMVDYFGADPSCTDAARFFFPCKEIVSASLGKPVGWKGFDADYVPENERYARRAARLRTMGQTGQMPAWLEDLLRDKVKVARGEGQHVAAYRCAANMAALGMSEEKAFDLLMRCHLSEIGEHDMRRSVTNGMAAELGKQLHGVR